MKYNAVVLVLLFFLLFTSCENSTEKNLKVDFDLKTFNEQKQLWQESGIKNYQYLFRSSGEIAYRGTVIVENGNFKGDIPQNELFTIERFMEYSSINAIYDHIETVFENYSNTKWDKEKGYVSKIEVEYDKDNHIPVYIHFYTYTQPGLVFDGVDYSEIQNFCEN